MGELGVLAQRFFGDNPGQTPFVAPLSHTQPEPRDFYPKSPPCCGRPGTLLTGICAFRCSSR